MSGSADDEAWYAVSLISYEKPHLRSGFSAVRIGYHAHEHSVVFRQTSLGKTLSGVDRLPGALYWLGEVS